MPEDADVWQALLRAKGLTVAQLAEDLRTTRQHAHRLLTGKRSADARRDELERALALGARRPDGRPLYALAPHARGDERERALAWGARRPDGRPLYALATLATDGELELLPAGDTQPLFA